MTNLLWSRRLAILLAGMVITCTASCSGDRQTTNSSSRTPEDAHADPAPETVDDAKRLDADANSEATSPIDVTADTAIDFVDPFIGTGGKGFGYAALTPAAQVPNGMVRLGPDTSNGEHVFVKHHFSGYHHSDKDVRGFSHTRLVGTGVPAQGNLRWLPVDSAPESSPWKAYSPIQKNSEEASPGYYKVSLENPDLEVELTTTTHGGLQRYTPKETGFSILFNPTAQIKPDKPEATEAEFAVERTNETYKIEGKMVQKKGFAARTRQYTVYFSTTIDLPPDSVKTWNRDGLGGPKRFVSGKRIGLILSYNENSAPIHIRTGISYVDLKQAKQHRKRQLKQKSFEQLATKAKSRWRDKLDTVQIKAPNKDVAEIFYTALYNAWRMPTRLDGHDGRYRGLDGQIYETTDFHYYTDLSLWDTFRTLHPWLTLVDPNLQADALESLVAMGRQGGYIPRWPAALSYAGSMIGTSANFLFAGSHAKGIDGVDYDRAFELLHKSSTQKPDGDAGFGGRTGVNDYNELGYVPAKYPQSVSRTLEFAWADWALANLAEDLNRPEADKLRDRGLNWQNVFESDSGFMRPKTHQGSWVEPFSPDQGADSEAYTEGGPWHWRFYALQTPEKLAEAFGGPEAFYDALSALFTESLYAEDEQLNTFLPHKRYWHGNEHDLHSAYLFHFSSEPGQVEKWVRRIQNRAYDAAPDGLPGNDDGGTLTGWYLFSALGLYPVSGSDKYLLGSPLVKRAQIDLGADRTLEVEARSASPRNYTVDRVLLDGAPVEGPYIEHSALMNSTLTFEMSSP